MVILSSPFILLGEYFHFHLGEAAIFFSLSQSQSTSQASVNDWGILRKRNGMKKKLILEWDQQIFSSYLTDGFVYAILFSLKL